MRSICTSVVCKTCWVLAAFVALLAASAAHAQEFVLVRQGSPAATIVVPNDASAKVRAAATELSDYLQRMSGANLPVCEESDFGGMAPGVFLGDTERASKAGVTVEQGGYPIAERYRIKMHDGDLLMAGNDAWQYDGTAYAVFDLLDRLGCRWYMPGAVGEVVPEMDTIAVSQLDVDTSPDFIERSGVWYEYHAENPEEAIAKLEAWRRHNRMGARWVSIGHSMSRIMPPDTYFPLHPEWFPLINGKRQTEGLEGTAWHPCVSNVAFRQFAAERAVEAFDASSSIRTYSLALNDGGWHGWCQCDACKAMGETREPYRGNQFTKRYLAFVDAVARRVAPAAPERLITCSAYASTQVPPKDMAPLADNVWIVIMHYYWSDQCKALCDDPFYKSVFEGFARLAPGRLGIYQYYGDFHYDQLPTPAWAFMDKEFAFYDEVGVRSMTIEGGNQWVANGLVYYVCAKMAWDSSLNPLDIVDDFCANYFGPAAQPMRRYFGLRAEAFQGGEKCERNPRKIPYHEYLDRFDAALAEAAAAAPGSLYGERIARYQAYQVYMRAYYDVIAGIDLVKQNLTEEELARQQERMDRLAALIEALGDEGAIAKPSAQHYTLGWMNKSQGQLADMVRNKE